MATEKSISFKNLLVGYNKSENKFPKISSHVNHSELIILLGRNGVGKSTLLRTIAGLQSPVSGELTVMGHSIDSYSQKEKASLISFVSTERLSVTNLSVYNLVSLGRYSYTNWLGTLSNEDETYVVKSMQMAGIYHLAEKNVNEISDGEMQRVMIARTLAQKTPIIILDEPTSFLDLPNKFEILLLLRNLAWSEGKTIILSTHDLEIAMRLADNMWIMTKEGLKQGAPEDFALHNNLQDIFEDTNISYDYNKGIIDMGTNYCSRINLQCNDSKINFWLTKALNRLNYSIDPDSNKIIEATNNSYVYKSNGVVKKFTSVYDLVKFLRNC